MKSDPLQKFKEGVRSTAKGFERPVPLTATAITVRIEGGMAVVTTERTFRNVEDQDIEATMTFPVPTDAALFSLSAVIDGRKLDAQCQAKTRARESYEDAVDRGKSAILHEELLKGVHMLSVGRVRPGAEVKVTGIWTAPLSFIGGRPGLRVPTTVGEIFGRQPLLDSDALVSGDYVHRATLRIECADGTATLLGGHQAKDGMFEIALDAPIDIAVSGWKPRTLQGVAADGRKVTVDIAPAPSSEWVFDGDFVSDRSGSMNEQMTGVGEARSSKHEIAMAGLRAYADKRVGANDCVRVWEFNDQPNLVGSAIGAAAIRNLFGRLRPPAGGTELGRAFDEIVAAEGAKNVVLLTDGKTWAFDPQKYARSGIRVTAVLVGEDALEGGVADLAGVTGGQIFVPIGADIDDAIAAAFDAARAPFIQAQAIEGQPNEISVARRGAVVKAVWSGRAKKSKEALDVVARAVGALAASLALPLMNEDAAGRLAAAEGIVCHLTSLVLVDEAGEASEGVPANRKVELTMPRTAMLHSVKGASLIASGGVMRSMALASPMPRFGASLSGITLSASRGVGGGLDSLETFRSPTFQDADDLSDFVLNTPPLPSVPPTVVGEPVGLVSILASAAVLIDWDEAPDALRAGDLSSLSPKVAAAIRAAAAKLEIVEAAKKAGMDPVVYVVALLARAAGAGNRTAGRVARLAFKSVPDADVIASARAIGF